MHTTIENTTSAPATTSVAGHDIMASIKNIAAKVSDIIEKIAKSVMDIFHVIQSMASTIKAQISQVSQDVVSVVGDVKKAYEDFKEGSLVKGLVDLKKGWGGIGKTGRDVTELAETAGHVVKDIEKTVQPRFSIRRY